METVVRGHVLLVGMVTSVNRSVTVRTEPAVIVWMVAVLVYQALEENYVKIVGSSINPWYTGRLFHCYILDESICHLRDVRSILSLLFYFWMENPVS